MKKPSKTEDKAINAAIAQDPDTFEATADEFNKARRGRPFAEMPKLPVSIRLDAPVVEYFKSTGKGWQGRINDLLAKHVAKERRKTG